MFQVLRASCLTLEVKEFRYKCEAKKEESEKVGSDGTY